MLIGTTRDRLETLLRYFEMIQTREVDGTIFMSTHFCKPEETDFLKQEYPIVCACEPMPDGRVPYVGIDDKQAARDAAEYLIACGHRRIGLICGGKQTKDTYGSSYLREKGFREVMEENGLPLPETDIFREGLTYNSGKRAARQMIDQKSLPEAVFACSDAAALGLIRELYTNGYAVPRDISVMGFDNTAMSEVFCPSVTTVSQPQYEIGRQAMDLLLARIEGKEGERRLLLPHEIICRESTRGRKTRG